MWQKSILLFHPRHEALEQVLASSIAADLNIEWVTSLPECLAKVAEQQWDMVLIPAIFGEGVEAAEIIQQLHWQDCRSAVVVLSEVHQAAQVTRALKKGAMDYLLLPFEAHHLNQLLQRMAVMKTQSSQVVAESEQSRQLFQLAQRVAQTDASVLINGESGTGKEVLAQFIHRSSARENGPFVAINCAAIPETMIESILFGHSKGAFTGAVSANAGKLEMANNGTLFLDEIGELPMTLQTKLLRVLQEREVERLGSHQKIKLNIRVLAATNQNLESAVAEGRFRTDLYYRLNVFPLTCPPLRERPEDIVPLAKHLLKCHQPQGTSMFTEAAKQRLREYPWPGNVRELDNVVQRALVMSRGCLIREEELMLPAMMATASQPMAVLGNVDEETQPLNLQQSRKQAEFETIIATLKRFNGHRNKTAQELGVTTRALRYKIQTMREQGVDIEKLLAGTDGTAEQTLIN
ncbi:sigma-54-dependent transcriptional regulator [Photobacterium aquae]|uniref:sigma-54-dependent transcriptional regulator n=1 Tax=Photobacterium aquae TaxID=1195763 RepID=UPI000A029C2E|nr:sigma-54 dependent transcriptional regulator [Photobacterium aquae]